MKNVKTLASNAYRRIMAIANRPYKSNARRLLAVAALDAALFAVFATLVSVPAVLLGASLWKTVLVCLLAWLAMDATACWLRDRKIKRIRASMADCDYDCDD